jgi:tetratricopeptide (TPR) repeat protein
MPSKLNGNGEKPSIDGKIWQIKKTNKKMSPSNEEILIDYLDNRLEGAERANAAQLIHEDATAAQEFGDLQFSVELIREAGIFEQVNAIRTTFTSGAKVVSIQKKEDGAIVRSFSKNALRIAAAVLLVVGAATTFKYATTSSSSVYNQNFDSFELSTSRGNNNDGELEQAYRNKNWTAVENLFAGQKEKTTKAWFLDGMAEMELKNYPTAILSFKEVLQMNSNNANVQYQDEAEYYLAMANLAAGKSAEGVAILKKIRNDKEHLFYKKASAISGLDLKLLELKK